MRKYTDWDCRLLPMMGDPISNPADSIRAMCLLKEKFGLTRFCMMPEFDCRVDSVSAFLIRREKAFSELLAQLPEDISVVQAASVTLRADVSREKGLHRLVIPKTNFLPLRLPSFTDFTSLSNELNRFFYHVPYRPLLLSFDRYLRSDSKGECQKWLRLPNVAFHFTYQSLEDACVRDALRLLAKQNASVFFGTGINSYKKACYYELDHYLDLSMKYFTAYERDALFFPKSITAFSKGQSGGTSLLSSDS